MEKEKQSVQDSPKENGSGGQIEIPVADAAFCRQCGEWLTSDHISLGITFRCPKCDYNLFSINRIGAREKWEKNFEQVPK
jgi:predicted Zn-ribbon and HTH transcriptional regulator